MCPCCRVPVAAPSHFLIHHFYLFMKKLTSLLMLALFLFTGLSMKAQTSQVSGYMKPGNRVSVSDLNVGDCVFVYSMCIDGDNNYSRFIVNSSNNATVLEGVPATLSAATTQYDYVWKVAEKTIVTNESGVSGTQIAFCRKMGTESSPKYWGIGSNTNNASIASAQRYVFTQWNGSVYNSDVSKNTSVQVCNDNGNALDQSSISDTDPVYLMAANNNGWKALSTAGGTYNGGGTTGTPVVLYSVATGNVVDGVSVTLSDAPADGQWASNTQWYKINISGNYWSVAKDYITAENYLRADKTTAPTDATGLWCVVGDINGGYKFYNMAMGPNYVLGTISADAQAPQTKMVPLTNTEGKNILYDFVRSNSSNGTDANGWCIKDHGSANMYFNIRGSYLAHWNSTAATTAEYGSGSRINFVSVTASDALTYAQTYKTAVLTKLSALQNAPDLWSDGASAYTTLNAVTTEESKTDLENAHKLAIATSTASTAFFESLKNKTVTLKSQATDSGENGRQGRMMNISSTAVTGVVDGSNTTLNEIITLVPTIDLYVSLYSSESAKYAKLNGTVTDALNASRFYIQSSSETVEVVENVVAFRESATNMFHLHDSSNGFVVKNYSRNDDSNFNDAASRWLVSSDISKCLLQTAINNVTPFKTNLETLVNNLVAEKKISVKPTTLSVTLPTAITKAQNALNNASGTPATRTAAAAALNATLTKAKSAWLGEFGTAQQFRLKSHTITTTETPAEGGPVTKNYYLTMAQTKDRDNEGNAILAAYAEADVNQIFTLVPGTGANAGKYILVSKSKQLTDLGAWNTDMTDAGTPYGFEDVDVANSLFRVRTTQGLLGPNSVVTGDNLATGKNKFLYTNHDGTRDNLTWELEFIAPALGAVDSTSLKNIYHSPTFVSKYGSNIVNQNSPSVAAYNNVKEKAWKVLAGRTGSTVTQIDVNTAEAELKAAYEQVLNNFISEADPSQGYRLAYYHPTNYTTKDLYLTFNPGYEETEKVNALQLKQRSAASLQSVELVSAGRDNSFYIVEGFSDGQVGEGPLYYWNPAIVTNGVAYTFEQVTLDGIDGTDGIVVRLKNPQGYLGCDLGDSHAAVAENDYLFTNNSENNYWIVQPCVSPNLVISLYNKIYEAKAYEKYVGTGVGKYSTAGGLDAEGLAYNNSLHLDFINETGAYKGKEKTNVGVHSAIDFYNENIFPITINKPTPGKLYRFKGKVTGKYMCAATANAQMSMVESLNNPGVIFQLKEGETIDGEPGYKFLSYNTGYYTKNTHNNGALADAANSIKITASETAANLGYYTLKANRTGNTEGSGIGTYLYDNGNVVDRNGEYKANNCDWTIEEVTDLPVPINTTVGFGTLYSPVALYAQDERLEFYYGTKQNVGGKDKLVLTKLTGNIPAETGFIVKYKGGVDEATGCVFMKIADSAPKLTEEINQLKGTLETVAKPTSGTVYTLQYLNNTLGLYKYTATNLKAGKAYYLLAEGSAVPMGFVFDFDGVTTGVESIEVNADNQVIYDLSGRRVAKAGKGLYIINGKKVLVK